MITALRAELVVLTRRSMLIGTILATMAVAALGTAAGYLTDSSGGPLAHNAGTVDLAAADGSVHGLLAVTKLLAAIALVVGVITVTNDYAHRTLTNLLVRHPRRTSLLSGRAGAVGVVVVALALVATITAITVSVAFAAANGVATQAWTSADGIAAIIETATAIALTNLTFAAIGVALGTTLRSAGPAIGLGLGWLLVAETIIAGLTSLGNWLPASLANDLVAGTTTMSSAAAVSALTLWLLAALTAGLAIFNRRDVE